MADNILATPGSGGTAVPLGFDSCTVNGIAGVLVSLGKVGFGGNDSFTYVTSTVGLPVAVVGAVALGAGSAVIGHVVVDSAPTTAVTGTFWQATQPVSAAALPLPAGAATAAKQPALGTAGGASADVLTVQGVASMTPLKVDGSAVTQPVSGTVTATGTFWQATQPVSLASVPLPAGAATAAKQPALGAAGSASADVLSVQGIAAGTPLGAALQATTSGGSTPYRLVSAATTNAASVKGSAGVLYSYSAFNLNAAPRYLKFFDKATAPTLGTDTPVLVVMIPGGTTGAGVVKSFAVGVQFSNGIAVAVVGGMADSDATAIGAAECCVNATFK
jgi:hypothetical protein